MDDKAITQPRRLRPGRWLIPPLLALVVAVVAADTGSPVLLVAAGGACVLVWVALTVLRRPLNALWRRTHVVHTARALRTRRGLGVLFALASIAIVVALLLPATRPASGYAALMLTTLLTGCAAAALRIDREVTSWGAWLTTLAGRAVGGIAIVAGCLLAALAAGDAAALLPWPQPAESKEDRVFTPADLDNIQAGEPFMVWPDAWHVVSASEAVKRLVYGPPPVPPLEHPSVDRARAYLDSGERSVLRLIEGTSVTDRGLVPLPEGDDRAMLVRAIERAEQGKDPLLAYRIAVALDDARQVATHEGSAVQRVASSTPDVQATFERTRAAFHLRRGDFARAIDGYEAALALTPEHAYMHADLAIALLLERERLLAWVADGRLGTATFDWGEPDALLERARVAFVDALVHMDRSMITYTNALSNAGWVYSAMGDAGTAHTFYDRALARDRALLEQLASLNGGTHFLATPLENLGRVHMDLGLYEAASEDFAEAIEHRRAHWGRAHPTIAVSLRLLGGALEADDRIDSAIEAYTEAVVVARDLAGDWPSRPPVGDLGGLPEHERAAILDEIRYGAFDELAPSLSALTNCLLRQGRSKEALAPAREALEFARWFLPEGHPEIAHWESIVRVTEFGADGG